MGENTSKKLTELWQDPKHWKWGVVYYCESDPRIVVFKRPRWTGWTFNFAHRSAYLLTVAILLIALVPSITAVNQGRTADLPLTIGFSLIFTGLLVLLVSRVGRD